MRTELEVKFYPVEKNKVRNDLKGIGATLTKDEVKMRRVVYSHHKNPKIRGTYARIRDEGGVVRVSLKVNAAADGIIADQKELDFTVDSFDAAKEFFDRVGLVTTGYQENFRETWNYLGSEIVIDTWPSLEPYIEIESPTEEELQEIATRLGFVWANKILVSTDELYARKYALTKEQALEKMEILTFEDNQFNT